MPDSEGLARAWAMVPGAVVVLGLAMGFLPSLSSWPKPEALLEWGEKGIARRRGGRL